MNFVLMISNESMENDFRKACETNRIDYWKMDEDIEKYPYFRIVEGMGTENPIAHWEKDPVWEVGLFEYSIWSLGYPFITVKDFCEGRFK